MSKSSGFYPPVRVDAAGRQLVSHAGGVLLAETVRAVGLDREMSAALGCWRRRQARHDPAKVLLDLAVTLALGGDCLADIATVRAAPDVFGPVASDATVSRAISGLAADADRVLAAIATARAAVRARVWKAAGSHAPNVDGTVTVDLDATLVTAHSDKEGATPTFKMGFGHHPLLGFVDHGEGGTGEMVAGLLREGRAGSNTAADHMLWSAKRWRRSLVSAAADPAAKFSSGLTAPARPMSSSTGYRLVAWAFPSAGHSPPAMSSSSATSRQRRGHSPTTPAVVCGTARSSPNSPDCSTFPGGRKACGSSSVPKRPHPGAQLRITDIDGNRITAFATNTATGQLAELELRHRRRARYEDRIRQAKDCGLRNLPLQGMDQNRIWLAIVTLAVDLIAWTQMLAFTGHEARRWEHKRLRHRLFSAAGRVSRHAPPNRAAPTRRPSVEPTHPDRARPHRRRPRLTNGTRPTIPMTRKTTAGNGGPGRTGGSATPGIGNGRR